MRLNKWHVEGFGALASHSSPSLNSNLVVIHGPNEAGKSTLLHFIRWMLFGQPTRLDDKARSRKPNRGAAWGGTLDIVSLESNYALQRRFGEKRDQQLALRSSDREWLNDDAHGELRSVLHGVDSDLFGHIYALDLQELSDLKLLDNDRVSSHLAMAGVMGAAQSANAALATLEKHFKTIIASRSSSAKLNDLAKRLSDVQTELQKAQTRALSYQSLLLEETRLKETRAKKASERFETRATLRRYDVLKSAWPIWLRYRQLETRLATIPDRPKMTVRVASEIEMLLASYAKRSNEREAAQAVANTIKARSATIELDELAYAVAGDIRRLAERAHATELQRNRVAEMSREQVLREQEIAELAASVDVDDFRSQIADRVLSFADTGEVERLSDSYVSCESQLRMVTSEGHDLDRRQLNLDAERAVLEEAVVQCNAEIAHFCSIDPLAGHANEEGTIPEQPTNKGSYVTLGMSAAFATVLFGAAIICAVNSKWFLLGISSIGAVAVAALTIWSFFRGHQNLPVGASNAVLAASTQSVEDLERMQRVAGLRADIQRLDRDLANVSMTFTQNSQRQATLLREADSLRIDWFEFVAAWLGETGEASAITQAIALPIAPRFLLLVKNLQGLLVDEKRNVGEVLRQQREIDQYDGEVSAAAEALGNSGTPLALLVERVDAACEAHARQSQEGLAMAESHTILERLDAELLTVSDELAMKRAELGADSSIELQTWIGDLHLRADVETQHRDLAQELQQVLGGGSEAVVLHKMLASGEMQHWVGEEEATEERLALLDAEIDQVTRELDRSTSLRQDLELTADVVALSAQRNVIATQLQSTFDDYVVLRAAETTIRSTLAHYESQRQPAVFTQASVWFEQITNGRYNALVMRDGVLRVRAHDGDEIDPEVLSQGTVEQLYLAIRFALASDLASRGNAMPFVLDDVLVNFDPIRARAVAELLVLIAKSGQQILLFTCHKATRDLILECDSTATCVELDRVRDFVGAAPTSAANLFD